MGKAVWISIVTWTIIIILFLLSYEKEEPVMREYVVLKKDDIRLFVMDGVGAKEPVEHIFPLPMANAVGTIDIDNAITAILFNETTEPDYKVIAKNFLREVNGAFEFGFCPVYSKDEIAYTQTRWAVIANVKNGKVITPILTMSLYERISGIRSLDTSTNRFLVEKITPGAGYATVKKYLHVMRLERHDFIDEGQVFGGVNVSGYKQPWLVHDRKIITYDSLANKLVCHDANLESAYHPFVDVFNRNSDKFRKLKEMVIHPTLPFGIVVEIGKDVDWAKYDTIFNVNEKRKLLDLAYIARDLHAIYLLRWDLDDPEKQFMLLHTDSITLIPPVKATEYSHFSFSPDGKWLVFADQTKERRKPLFTVLPVDTTRPHLFGGPVFLGPTPFKYGEFKSSAWATDPTSYVVCNGRRILFKWDLGMLHHAQVVHVPEDSTILLE